MTKLQKWDDILTFGKHRGKTIKDVFKSDIGYLVWLMEETDRCDLEPHIERMVEDEANSQLSDVYPFDPNWD